MTRAGNALAAVEAFILREQKSLKRKRAASSTGASKRPADGQLGAAPPAAPPVEKPARGEPQAAAAPAASPARPGPEAVPAASAHVLTAFALATPMSMSDLSMEEQLALSVLISPSFQFLCKLPNANHIVNPSKYTFPVKAKGGGNFKHTRLSSRELTVELDAQNLAKWTPKVYYQQKMDILRDFAQQPGVEKSSEGLMHPVLRFSTLKIKTSARQELVQKIFGYAKNPELLFRQFLCTIAVRSHMAQDFYTWAFDPDAWNREGYRLMPGCDSKGKPRVTFV